MDVIEGIGDKKVALGVNQVLRVGNFCGDGCKWLQVRRLSERERICVREVD